MFYLFTQKEVLLTFGFHIVLRVALWVRIVAYTAQSEQDCRCVGPAEIV